MVTQLLNAQTNPKINEINRMEKLSQVELSSGLKMDPNVRRGKLENGLTYYIRHNKTKIGSADFMLANKVGSIQEKEHERGLAHFIEHMAFNGTKNFPKNSIIDYLQQQGIRFGADLNAYTGFDETIYLFPIPTQNQEVVSQGLQILRDWAGNISFDPKEIDQERGVILEEKRATDNVGKRIMSKILPISTNNSLYGSRLPIGIEEVLRGFERKDILNFYHTWYRPDRQAVIVVGDIDVDNIEKLIKEKFGDLKVKTKNLTPKEDPIRLSAENQYLLVSDPEITQIELQIGIKRYGQIRNSVSAYRYAVLETLLSYMFANRFRDLSMRKDEPYKSIMVSYGDTFGGLKSTNFIIKPKDDRFEEAVVKGYKELLRVKESGFTDVEFQQAKRQLGLYYDKQIAEYTKSVSAMYLEKYKAEFLKGTVAMDILDEQELGNKIINSLSLDEINLELKKWLKDEDRDYIISAPERLKSEMPDITTLLAWMKKSEQEKLEPYVAQDVLTRLMDPQSVMMGKVVAQKLENQTNTTEIKLSNGITVVLLPTDFKDNEVLIAAASKGGYSVVDNADFIAAKYAAEFNRASGVANINPSSLSKFLMAKNINMGPYISEFEEGMQGSTGKGDIESALQLMHLYFTKPRIDDNSYVKMREQIEVSLKNRHKIAENVFSDSLMTWLSNNHLRKQPPHQNDILHLDSTKMMRIYKDRFADASDFTFFVVGSIDIDHIVPLVSKYLGTLPAKGVKENFVDPKIKWHEGALEKTVYAGEEDKATVMLYMSDSFLYNSKSRLQLQALENALKNKLLSRLREKESGVYTPNVRISLSKMPSPRYTIEISFSCAINNVEHLVSATKQEMLTLQNEGVLPQALSKFKNEREILLKDAQKNNMYWLSVLKNQYLYGEHIVNLDDQLKALKNLSTSDVKNAAIKYIQFQNLKKFVLLPKTN